MNSFVPLRTICVLLIVSLTCSSCLHFVRTGAVESVKEATVNLSELEGAFLVDGMTAAENIYLDPDSLDIYVSTLRGMIYLVDGNTLTIHSSLKAGAYALGIDRGPDGMLYVGVCSGSTEEDWKKTGGAVYRVDPALTSATAITETYPCFNGLAIDNDGTLFFTSSNFNFLAPKGVIYHLSLGSGQKPGPVSQCIPDMGLANGLYHHGDQGRIFWTDTLESAGVLIPQGEGVWQSEIIYRKTAFKEAFDDLCMDSRGRLWMADPIRKTLKVYDPNTDSLVRYTIEGFGQASSCRIRMEEGNEILYVTELVGPVKDKATPYNGRGLLRVPLASLEG